jgi:hypothetical protein
MPTLECPVSTPKGHVMHRTARRRVCALDSIQVECTTSGRPLITMATSRTIFSTYPVRSTVPTIAARFLPDVQSSRDGRIDFSLRCEDREKLSAVIMRH